MRFGVIGHYANQRLLPTKAKIYAKRGDIDFDEQQNSALDMGTPLYRSPRKRRWEVVLRYRPDE